MSGLSRAADPVIRIERDPAFWEQVAAHPAVRPTLYGLNPKDVAAHAVRPEVLPVAAEHGGFLAVQIDALGLVRELHTLFTPEGWGREVFIAAKLGLGLVFQTCQVLTTFQAQNNPRSQPPRSFGFVQAGDWQETALGPMRAWVLTRAAWRSSPGAKSCRLPLSDPS